MDTSDLRYYLQKHPVTRYQRIPILAMDELPLVKPRPFFCIVNTDTSVGDGIHWIALHFPLHSTDELFDSLNRKPRDYKMHMYLEHDAWTSSYVIQSQTSILCGAFCIYYVIKRSLGYTADEIVSLFHRRNLELNDGIVEHFLKSLCI